MRFQHAVWVAWEVAGAERRESWARLPGGLTGGWWSRARTQRQGLFQNT